jgi:hypothetical protein
MVLLGDRGTATDRSSRLQSYIPTRMVPLRIFGIKMAQTIPDECMQARIGPTLPHQYAVAPQLAVHGIAQTARYLKHTSYPQLIDGTRTDSVRRTYQCRTPPRWASNAYDQMHQVAAYFFFFGFFFFVPPPAGAPPAVGAAVAGTGVSVRSASTVLVCAAGAEGVGIGRLMFCIFSIKDRLSASNRFRNIEDCVLNLIHW